MSDSAAEATTTPDGPSALGREDLVGLGVLLAVVMAIKLVFLSSVRGPVVFPDELVYARFAKTLASGSLYASTQYPPLYPLVLAPLHAFGQQWYAAAKVLNALLSTALLIPAYLLARAALERAKAMACTVVIALLPFHYTLPRTMLSENLYFPLLLLAAYMVLVTPKRKPVAWDLATAAILGALCLTRYISIALVPALYLAWWLRPFDENDLLLRPSFGKLRRLAAMAVLTAAVFAPWVIGQMQMGASFSNTLGFGIAARTNPGQLTLPRLLVWAGIYGAYFVLLASPILGLLILSPIEAARSRTRGYYERLVVLVVGLFAGTMAAVVRHSWRAYYNSRILAPEKIMGRYAVYFGALFVILVFVGLPRFEKWFTGRRRWVGVSVQVVSVVALIVAWLVMLRDITGIAISPVIMDRGAVDLYRLAVAGWPALAVAIIVLIALAWTLHYRPAWSYAVLTVGLVTWLSLGVLGYNRQLAEHQVYAEHSWQLNQAVEKLGLQDAPVVIRIDDAVLGVPEVDARRIWWGMGFWGSEGFTQRGWILRRRGEIPATGLRLELAPAPSQPVILRYEAGGVAYAIVPGRN